MTRNNLAGKIIRCSPVLSLAVMGCVTMHASVIADAQINLFGLQIVPTAGTLTFIDPWMAQAFAQGQNSLGELNAAFNGPGLTESADGSVTYVTPAALADSILLSASASSLVHIPGDVAEGDGTARGTLISTFQITGGTGSVDVQYTAIYSGTLSLSTDMFGQMATGEFILSLLRDGNNVLFSNISNSIGSSGQFNVTLSGPLTHTETLQYNTPYSLILEVDAESMGVDNAPEPGTVGLVLVALALLAKLHRHKVRRASAVPVTSKIRQ